jgi:hypothetical protein
MLAACIADHNGPKKTGDALQNGVYWLAAARLTGGTP